MSEELDSDAVSFEPVTPFSSTDTPIQRVMIQNGSFKWSAEDLSPTIEKINLSVYDAKLVSIVGTVGSGKSSIISALLGEMYRTEGTVSIRGSIAYVPQTAWIMNATLRDNILFGRRYEEKFYHETIEACGLVPDMEQLPGGDMTEIGERGINLSGGQKQRISLARAVYSQADIYLLDDSLSAVDAHVGRHIFDKVIGPKGLLKEKARVFVTNAIHYLPLVNFILFLSSGSIAESGSYKELMEKKTLLYNLMKEYGKQDHSQSRPGSIPPSRDRTKSDLPLAVVQTKPSAAVAAVKEKSTLMSQEDNAKGSVAWSVYQTYAKSCSYRSVIFYLCIAITSQVLIVSQNLYLAKWASFNDDLKDHPDIDQNIPIWLGFYALIGLVFSLSIVSQVIFIWVFCGIRWVLLVKKNLNILANGVDLREFCTTTCSRTLYSFLSHSSIRPPLGAF
jgi:ABC-type Mn2+/Zn2+ transport system ATPase subunit